MKSGIIDKNGVEVKAGDKIAIPYIDPIGNMHEEEDYVVDVVFDHGCFGYYRNTKFIPLFNWNEVIDGDYISNYGVGYVYTGKYPFWVK